MDGAAVFGIQGSNVRCRADLAALFDSLLSRREELAEQADAHGRFPLSASALLPYIDVPVLDVWARALRDVLGEAGCGLPAVEVGEAPGQWHAVLTHDVDHVDWTARRPARGLGGPRRRRALDRLRLGRGAGERAIDLWSRLERRRGWSSTWFLLGQRRGTHNRGYVVSDARLAAIMGRLRAAGHEIGLHGSYDAMDDPARLASEARRIADLGGGELAGCRMHYLRARWPRTQALLAEAGFRYDATLGYTAAVGFRAGTSRPFEARDPHSGSPLGITELPFSMMDCSFLSALRLGLDGARRRMSEQMRVLADLRGCAVLLFHPCRLASDGDAYDELYRHGLDEIESLGGVPLTAGEICRRYRARAAAAGEILDGDRGLLHLRLRFAEGTEGLRLEVPPGWAVASASRGRPGRDGSWLALPSARGPARIEIRLRRRSDGR